MTSLWRKCLARITGKAIVRLLSTLVIIVVIVMCYWRLPVQLLLDIQMATEGKAVGWARLLIGSERLRVGWPHLVAAPVTCSVCTMLFYYGWRFQTNSPGELNHIRVMSAYCGVGLMFIIGWMLALNMICYAIL